MIMHIGYSNGYNDALRDVLAWFDNHSPLFPKKAHKMIMVILRKIFQNRNIFIVDKENYCFEFTAEEMKYVGVKSYLPEPSRWKYIYRGENAHFGFCPKCKQEHLFFTLEELLNANRCPVCKTELLPPEIKERA